MRSAVPEYVTMKIFFSPPKSKEQKGKKVLSDHFSHLGCLTPCISPKPWCLSTLSEATLMT